MSRIDQLTEEMNDLRRVKGLSESFDQQLKAAEVTYRRAVDSARGGDDRGFPVMKAQRSVHYLKFEFGHVRVKCVACNGSGRYDNTGSPACGCCDGSGKTSEPGPNAYLTLIRKIDNKG